MNYMDRFVRQAEHFYRTNKRKVRVLQAVTAMVIILSVILIRTSYGEAKVADQIQMDIAEQIIRFHVLANSNSDEDQQVKLKVKEEVVHYMQDKLASCESKEEAKQILREQESEIKNLAIDVLRKNGYAYDVTCELSKEYFPVKVYGDLTFPAGNYDAFRILIGNAEGKNWWCVMFPSLCLVNETYSVVPEDSKNKLKHVLSEEDYEAIDTSDEEINADTSGDLIEEEPKVEYHFWLYDALSNLF